MNLNGTWVAIIAWAWHGGLNCWHGCLVYSKQTASNNMSTVGWLQKSSFKAYSQFEHAGLSRQNSKMDMAKNLVEYIQHIQ
eukprot:1799848-Ditylum_brightwellii.AAC.1